MPEIPLQPAHGGVDTNHGTGGDSLKYFLSLDLAEKSFS